MSGAESGSGNAADDVVAAFGESPVKTRELEKASAADEVTAADGESQSSAMSADAPVLDPSAFFEMLRPQPQSQPQPQPHNEPTWPTAPDWIPTPAWATEPVAPITFAPPKRHPGRVLLRWTSAALVMAAVGAGTAFAVTRPARTDIPGLATKSDGRYFFPFLAKPAAPADLRQYLLPAPQGATIDAAYPGAAGWYSTKDFLGQFASSDDLGASLGESGLRRIAAEGWTMADGQHTVVELLQFPDKDAALQADSRVGSEHLSTLTGSDDTGEQVKVPGGVGKDDESVDVMHYKAVQATGSQEPDRRMSGRVAEFVVGDVLVEVIASGPATMPDLPTEQVILLQAEMLR